jgi:hypothetical protein
MVLLLRLTRSTARTVIARIEAATEVRRRRDQSMGGDVLLVVLLGGLITKLSEKLLGLWMLWLRIDGTHVKDTWVAFTVIMPTPFPEAISTALPLTQQQSAGVMVRFPLALIALAK